MRPLQRLLPPDVAPVRVVGQRFEVQQLPRRVRRGALHRPEVPRRTARRAATTATTATATIATATATARSCEKLARRAGGGVGVVVVVVVVVVGTVGIFGVVGEVAVVVGEVAAASCELGGIRGCTRPRSVARRGGRGSGSLRTVIGVDAAGRADAGTGVSTNIAGCVRGVRVAALGVPEHELRHFGREESRSSRRGGTQQLRVVYHHK